jgi:molybdate transport system ATP-binding protein
MSIDVRAAIERDTGFSLDVDLSFAPDKVTALYGPSGSGKTTILRLIAGLESGSEVDQVEVTCNGEVWQSTTRFVPPHKRNIGYVFQHLNLFPHLNVQQNLMFASRRRRGGRIRGARKQHNQEAGNINQQQIVELLDIQQLMNSSPAQLSGGEQQRVAIARALFSDPKLLVMDEPLGSIDREARARILTYLQKLQTNLTIPAVYVSHSLDEVLTLADFVHELKQGKLVNSCNVVEFAADLESHASDVDAAAIIACEVTEQDEHFALTQVSFEGATLYISAERYSPSDQIKVRIPARDVSLNREEPQTSSILNVIEMTISDVHDPGSGPSAMVKLRRGNQHLLARITRKSLSVMRLRPGEQIFAQIKGVALITDYER